MLATACAGRVSSPGIAIDSAGAPTFQSTIEKQNTILDRVSLTVIKDDGSTETHDSTEPINPFDVMGNTYRFGPDTTLALGVPASWVEARWTAEFRGAFNVASTDQASRTVVDLDVEDVQVEQDGVVLEPFPSGQPGVDLYAARRNVPLSIAVTIRNASQRDLPHGATVGAELLIFQSPDVPTTTTGSIDGPLSQGALATIELPPLTIVSDEATGAFNVRIGIVSANTNPENDSVLLTGVWLL